MLVTAVQFINDGHNEELHNLELSPNNIRVIKSKMRWAGNVARMWETRIGYKDLVEKKNSREGPF
jgi:hypothetical protein